MRITSVVVVALILTVGSDLELGAQVTRPRTNPGDRLPAPASVTAVQEADGRIRVVWKSVDGAFRYLLTRSVPPTPQARVDLPTPSDTEYVDSDVKPGDTYYYVVAAANEAGARGLNISSQPVKAVASPTGADPATPEGFVPAPTNVVAKPFPYMRPTVSWKSSKPGLLFILERQRTGQTGTGIGKTGWEQVLGSRAGGLLSCCEREDHQAPKEISLVYQVTAIDTAQPNKKSTPTRSNVVGNYGISVAPPVLNAMPVEEGQSRALPQDALRSAKLRQTKWVSLSRAVSLSEVEGWVKGEYVGQAYIVATGEAPSGAIQSFIWRVHVIPKQ